MKLFRISTLGSDFLFASAPRDDDQIPKGAVSILLSDKVDFAVSYSEGGIFIPDLKRAIAVYIKRVLGYPASEYDIDMPMGKTTLYVGRENVYKTRIDASATCIGEISLGEASVKLISVCRAVYAIIDCEYERGADLCAILNAAKINCDIPVGAAMAISERTDGYDISYQNALRSCVADSRAYAAALAFIKSEKPFKEPSALFRSNMGEVQAYSEGSGVVIYSTDAEVSRVY